MARHTLIFICLLLIAGLNSTIYAQSGSWVAPQSADAYKNPYQGNEQATLAGKKLYNQYCAICHGKKGKGDGMAGMSLKPRPANFTKAAIQEQSDGALFWKMTEGKAPMAAYKGVLTEEERWHLVNFLRALGE